MWHIVYRSDNGVSQYYIARSKEEYDAVLIKLQNDGCRIISCWSEDIFGRKTVLYS